MDIEQFRQQLQTDLENKRDEYARAERDGIEHAMRTLKEFFDLAKVVNELRPDFTRMEGGSVDEFGSFACSIAFGRRRISFSTHPLSETIEIQGMDEELRSAIPEKTEGGLIQALRDSFVHRQVGLGDLPTAVGTFAEVIRGEVLKKENI